MSPYNPNSIWTSKDNPNLPRTSRSSVRPQPHEQKPEGGSPPPGGEHKEPPHDEHRRPEPRPMGSPKMRSILSRYGLWLFGAGIVVLIGGTIALVEFLKPPAAPPVSLSITLPATVTVGAPLVVLLSTANNSNVTLKGAVATLQLPAGIEFTGSDSSVQVQEYPLGDIAPGAVVAQTSTLIVTGAPAQLYALSAKLLYTTSNTPSTTYEADRATSFIAGPSAVGLSYSAPTNIVSGQNFPVTVNYVNGGGQSVTNARITLQYSPAYTFATSSLMAATGTKNTAWDLGTLAPGQGGSLIVTGAVVGPAGTQYQIIATVLTGVAGQEYPVNVQPVNVALVPSPLALSIAVNNSSSYVAEAGNALNYVLNYTNNSAATLSSVKITAALSGKMYDFASLQTAGAFNSNNDTVTWYAANTPALASLAPGQSGSVQLSVNTKQTFPIRLPSDKDYVLNLIGTIETPTVLTGASGASTMSVVTQSTKVAGAIALDSEGYWKSGPYPPKVNKPSVYTIDWTVTNYSTDAENVTMSAYLQSGTMLVGIASSTQTTSTPVYDAGTGEVSWTIPFIPAGTGITDAPVRAQFTVTNTPAVNQAGNDVTLLGPATLTATDAWTGGALSADAAAVTTALPNDTALGKGSRTVTQ